MKENSKNIKKKIKISIFCIFVISIIIFGIILGITSYKWRNIAKEMLKNENSIVQDTKGNTIAILGSEKKKKTISYEEMSENLPNAYIAIEDERFNSHHGVDIKRTGSAILSYIFHGGYSSFGGSTITQQLVKNLTGDSTDSIARKVKEWWKAWQLESILSKEELLEAYLNIIYVGPNLYGVETGSEYYFDKQAKDLTLAECAFLAGINHSPNSYNPFGEENNSEKIENRTKIVLSKMLELNQINQNIYEQAILEVEKGLSFKKGNIQSGDGIYSYHTDQLINEVTEDISKDKKISTTFATNYLEMAGLTIYSTQDSSIQNQTEQEMKKKSYMLTSKQNGDSSQAAMVILDSRTGKVVSCVGGLGEKTTPRGLNRATQSIRQTGSAIKPLAVLAPGIDKKIITASSIFDDSEQTFADGYSPKNYSDYLGNITVRRAVESSQNIPFVEMMEKITPKKAINYLEKMGITTLTKKDENLALALGGLEKGISPLEMAAAYETIANDGIYIEPTFYTKIVNKDGSILLESKQKKQKVFSKEVAYILKELLTQPVKGENGTATYCSISGIDVAAKTGTTDEDYDRWLCGFTPYYTAVTWFGFDQNETIYYNEKNPAGIIWSNVMKNIHRGLTEASFEKPSSITTCMICANSGKKTKTGCKNTYKEYFLLGITPEECTLHTNNLLKNENSSSSNNTSNLNNINKSNSKNTSITMNSTNIEEMEKENRAENQNININKNEDENQSNNNQIDNNSKNTQNSNNQVNSNTNNAQNISSNSSNHTNTTNETNTTNTTNKTSENIYQNKQNITSNTFNQENNINNSNEKDYD